MICHQSASVGQGDIGTPPRLMRADHHSAGKRTLMHQRCGRMGGPTQARLHN